MWSCQAFQGCLRTNYLSFQTSKKIQEGPHHLQLPQLQVTQCMDRESGKNHWRTKGGITIHQTCPIQREQAHRWQLSLSGVPCIVEIPVEFNLGAAKKSIHFTHGCPLELYTQLIQTGSVLLLLPISTMLGFTLYEDESGHTPTLQLRSAIEAWYAPMGITQKFTEGD